MAKANRKTYYWDSCSFIAWIDGGKGYSKDIIDGLDGIAQEVHENKANLCTSVMTETEILQGKLSPEQSTKLQNLFKRRNVILIGVDSKIARTASEIRNYYNARNIHIMPPDSIHLATAIIYGVDEFHTLDGCGGRQRPSDLLHLNGNVAGHSLHIRVPVAVQPTLFGAMSFPTLEVDSAGGNDQKVPKEDTSALRIQGASPNSVDTPIRENNIESNGKTEK